MRFFIYSSSLNSSTLNWYIVIILIVIFLNLTNLRVFINILQKIYQNNLIDYLTQILKILPLNLV